MSCGCKGAQAGAQSVPQAAAMVPAASADMAGKAQVVFSVSAQVTLHPCADCAKDGAKTHTVAFSASTGPVEDSQEKRLDVIVAGLKAAAAAAKAKHESH